MSNLNLVHGRLNASFLCACYAIFYIISGDNKTFSIQHECLQYKILRIYSKSNVSFYQKKLYHIFNNLIKIIFLIHVMFVQGGFFIADIKNGIQQCLVWELLDPGPL